MLLASVTFIKALHSRPQESLVLIAFRCGWISVQSQRTRDYQGPHGIGQAARGTSSQPSSLPLRHHLSSQTHPNTSTHMLRLSGSPDLHRLPNTPSRPLQLTLIYPCIPKALHAPPLPLLSLPRPSPCLPLPPLHPIKRQQPPSTPAPGCCSLSPARPPSSCSSP